MNQLWNSGAPERERDHQTYVAKHLNNHGVETHLKKEADTDRHNLKHKISVEERQQISQMPLTCASINKDTVNATHGLLIGPHVARTAIHPPSKESRTTQEERVLHQGGLRGLVQHWRRRANNGAPQAPCSAMYRHVHIYICLSICIHTTIHTYVRTYARTYIDKYTYIYI